MAGNRWRIRALREEDLDAIMVIERASFPTPWSRISFQQELANPLSYCWVAERDEEGEELEKGPVGYLCVWLLCGEMHIMNLATHPSYRRRAVARVLLTHVLERAAKMGVGRIVLEVRLSNVAAQGLYRSMGFRRVGKRSGYYRDTGEDAIVMAKRIDAV